jgi:hypothetical protein
MFRGDSGTLGKLRRWKGRFGGWIGTSGTGINDGFSPITEGASHLPWGTDWTDERSAVIAIGEVSHDG